MARYTEVLQSELTTLDLAILALGERWPLTDLVRIGASHP
jgi:hypothetical protein